jgi:hypothetical protein
MRHIRPCLLPVAIAGVLLLAFAGSASAASFPCGSFLHQLHHGKLTDTIVGEEAIRGQVERWQRAIQRDSQAGLPEPAKSNRINHDRGELAEWRGRLHYVTALIARIEQESCDAFDYPGIIKWIRHRSGRLHADRLRLAGDGSLKAAFRVNYDTGGILALDPAGVRIKAIAAEHGVTIPEPKKS